MNLTNKQLMNRWVAIKKQIKERPLLAYRTGIKLEEWDKYMRSIPEISEINRIYNEIQEDRKEKTLRIKERLSKIVGYRESVNFANKSGVSDSYIRGIIQGKNEKIGYSIIDKLEVFLHLETGFEISLENTLTVKEYSLQLMDEIRKDINSIENSLTRLNRELYEIGKTMKLNDENPYYSMTPIDKLQYNLEQMEAVKLKLINYNSLYLK